MEGIPGAVVPATLLNSEVSGGKSLLGRDVSRALALVVRRQRLPRLVRAARSRLRTFREKML